LTTDQKQCWLHISSDLLCNAEMSDRVITGDEMWCFQYDPETKWWSTRWKTQNQRCYLEVLTRLRESVRKTQTLAW